jgi:hypothetical protein
LALALERGLRNAEDQLNVLFKFDGTSGSAYITETPMCYYRVYVKRKRNLKVV